MIEEAQRVAIFVMAKERYSAGIIARRLGLTRNQVIGIISRAKAKGVDLPLSQTRENRPPRPYAPPHPRVVKPEPPSLAPEAVGPIGAFAGPGVCQFIRGDMRPDFQMCGHPGYPWCDYHKSLCYVPPNSRKRADDHNG